MARITLSTHWKFLRLARALGSKVLARGILETLWEPCWVAGDAYVGTSGDIEALCEWTGEPGALTKMLLMPEAKGAGFIEPYKDRVRGSEAHYQVHDFLHHCPEYVRRRRGRETELAAAKNCVICGEEYYSRAPNSQVCSPRCRQKLYRDRLAHPGEHAPANEQDATAGDTLRQRDGCDVTLRLPRYGRDVTLQHLHVLGTNVPSTQSGTGTESESTESGTGTETGAAKKPVAAPAAAKTPEEGWDLKPDAPATPPAGSPRRATALTTVDTSVVLLTFPVTGEKGPTWPLREAQVTRWAELYPSLDVLGEARQCLGWIEADLARRKTFGGMQRCLVAWFNRSVDQPRGRGGGGALVVGSLKTAGNRAALEEVLRRRGHVVD